MRIFMFNFSKHKLKDEEEASTFKCGICFETMLATSTSKFENNRRCVHSICIDCVAKHIKVSIEGENRAKIRCPFSPFCDQLLDPLSCSHIIPAPLFDKWCHMLCNLALLESDTCYCPYRDCSALVIVNKCGVGDDGKRSECPYCNRPFCFQCKQPWHAGSECEDSGGDLEFGVVQKRKNVCKHCVELAEGCSSECKAKHIKVSIEGKNGAKIRCPYCPYRDCSALVIVNECGVGDDVRRSDCPCCNRLSCFQCKQPWHASYECEDSGGDLHACECKDIGDDLEFGWDEKKRKEWMRCPACKHYFERTKGFHILYCRCGRRFCNNCGRKWDAEHLCIDRDKCVLFFAISLVLFLLFFLLFMSQQKRIQMPPGVVF